LNKRKKDFGNSNLAQAVQAWPFRIDPRLVETATVLQRDRMNIKVGKALPP